VATPLATTSLPRDPRAVEVVLCDADGNLFPSEEPAFEASTVVTNDLLQDLGIGRRFSATELRRAAMGRTFRATATWLADEHGAALEPERLERYVERERQDVIAHLSRTLKPDDDVRRALRRLGRGRRLAIVSSSALARLDACVTATGLAEAFPPDTHISAEDSLAVPTSKPDPAVYAFALEQLGVPAERALAIEDAVAGVRSAVAAGIPVIGNLHFTSASERVERAEALRAAGAAEVVGTWDEVAERLS
jgi:HAD superfamily hydrolase (TIGR01509 family)